MKKEPKICNDITNKDGILLLFVISLITVFFFGLGFFFMELLQFLLKFLPSNN